MTDLKKNQSGFTLIELLIVVIIVAILVAVGVPLLQGNVERAKLTEADAGLGTIRTGMRAYYAEHAKYALPADFSVIGIKLPTVGPPATPGDLDGRYFSQVAYTNGGTIPLMSNVTDTTYCAGVNGANSTNPPAPGAADVVKLKRSMNQDGTIYNSTDCSGTAVN